jgi:hypothetical protein
MKVVCRRQPNWINFEINFPCEVHLQYPEFPFDPNDGVYRVYCDSFEPSSSCANISFLQKILPLYNLVLTKNPIFINLHKNAKLFYFGGSFVYPEIPKNKNYSVSFLTTKPSWHLPGYDLRYELWKRQNEINIPKIFYSSNRMPIDTTKLLPGNGSNLDKIILFESMFHICIENTLEPNYFTEKIVDCFWTETLPIYWGHAETINKLFDSNGVIFFKNVDELISICNNLKCDDYYAKLDSIKKNKIASEQYCIDMNIRLKNKILESIS